MSTEKNKEIDGILTRLKYAKNFNTWKEVAVYLGESEATVSIWRKRNSPSAKEKILYRTTGDISHQYLLTGEGQPSDADASSLRERIDRKNVEIAELQREIESMPEDEPAELPDEWLNKGFSELSEEEGKAAIKIIFTPRRILELKVGRLKIERDLMIAGESWKKAVASDAFTLQDLSRLWDELMAANRQKMLPATRPNTDTDAINVSAAFDHSQLHHVPLISWVQAGAFVDPQAQTTPGYAEETVPYFGRHQSEGIFALRVKNDSMEPEFRDGDIIIVNPDKQAENGSYIVAKNGDHEATLKQLVLDGSKVLLKPLNERYDIIDMTGHEFRIVGVVVFKLKGY